MSETRIIGYIDFIIALFTAIIGDREFCTLPPPPR
jgi:hypothetical protein